jgi:hypothetical protein
MNALGKVLIVFGLLIAVLGVVVSLSGKVPWLGNLPGDIQIKTERFRFYFPLGTSLLISGVLSLVFYLLKR